MPKSENTSPIFDLFWEDTNLNEKNIIKFVSDFDNQKDVHNKIKYCSIDLKLTLPKDKLFKVMAKRHSDRDYNNYQMRIRELSSLFSCFAEVDYHRLLPSAGGKYPIEVYAMCFNVEGKLNHKVVYYNYWDNSLSIIAECDDWSKVEKSTSLLLEGAPSILFLFVAFPDRVVAKYGERGGRFLLVESGHYLQNLSLRVAYENLKGVEVGGLLDNEIKEYLKLGGTNAIITMGFACGK